MKQRRRFRSNVPLLGRSDDERFGAATAGGDDPEDSDDPSTAPLTAIGKKAVAAGVTFAATGLVAVAVRKVRERRRSA